MTFHMGIPQLVLMGWFLFALGCAVSMHGKPRTGNWNALISLVVIVIETAILYWGGWFS